LGDNRRRFIVLAFVQLTIEAVRAAVWSVFMLVALLFVVTIVVVLGVTVVIIVVVLGVIRLLVFFTPDGLRLAGDIGAKDGLAFIGATTTGCNHDDEEHGKDQRNNVLLMVFHGSSPVLVLCPHGENSCEVSGILGYCQWCYTFPHLCHLSKIIRTNTRSISSNCLSIGFR
jgi:hypothetical protein